MKAPTRITSPLARALAVGHMPAKHPAGHYVIESSSQAEMDYRMRVYGDHISCDCPAGSFGRDCLHRAALQYCLDRGIIGVYALCANCRKTRVAKVGTYCLGCAWQLAAIAEQEGWAA